MKTMRFLSIQIVIIVGFCFSDRLFAAEDVPFIPDIPEMAIVERPGLSEQALNKRVMQANFLIKRLYDFKENEFDEQPLFDFMARRTLRKILEQEAGGVGYDAFYNALLALSDGNIKGAHQIIRDAYKGSSAFGWGDFTFNQLKEEWAQKIIRDMVSADGFAFLDEFSIPEAVKASERTQKKEERARHLSAEKIQARERELTQLLAEHERLQNMHVAAQRAILDRLAEEANEEGFDDLVIEESRLLGRLEEIGRILSGYGLSPEMLIKKEQKEREEEERKGEEDEKEVAARPTESGGLTKDEKRARLDVEKKRIEEKLASLEAERVDIEKKLKSLSGLSAKHRALSTAAEDLDKLIIKEMTKPEEMQNVALYDERRRIEDELREVNRRLMESGSLSLNRRGGLLSDLNLQLEKELSIINHAIEKLSYPDNVVQFNLVEQEKNDCGFRSVRHAILAYLWATGQLNDREFKNALEHDAQALIPMDELKNLKNQDGSVLFPLVGAAYSTQEQQLERILNTALARINQWLPGKHIEATNISILPLILGIQDPVWEDAYGFSDEVEQVIRDFRSKKDYTHVFIVNADQTQNPEGARVKMTHWLAILVEKRNGVALYTILDSLNKGRLQLIGDMIYVLNSKIVPALAENKE